MPSDHTDVSSGAERRSELSSELAFEDPSADLLRPISGKDLADFTDFYIEAAPRLVAFLRWQGAPLGDAADLIQDTLTRCYQRWTTITKPYPWCRTVAGRLYARHLGTVREQLHDQPEQIGEPLLSSTVDVDAIENRHTLLSVIDQLPLRQRQVLAWTYDGADTREIAVALKISDDAVRSNVRHARTELRRRRDQLGVDQ